MEYLEKEVWEILPVSTGPKQCIAVLAQPGDCGDGGQGEQSIFQEGELALSSMRGRRYLLLRRVQKLQDQHQVDPGTPEIQLWELLQKGAELLGREQEPGIRFWRLGFYTHSRFFGCNSLFLRLYLPAQSAVR